MIDMKFTVIFRSINNAVCKNALEGLALLDFVRKNEPGAKLEDVRGESHYGDLEIVLNEQQARLAGDCFREKETVIVYCENGSLNEFAIAICAGSVAKWKVDEEMVFASWAAIGFPERIEGKLKPVFVKEEEEETQPQEYRVFLKEGKIAIEPMARMKREDIS
jgi:hypothetical protein